MLGAKCQVPIAKCYLINSYTGSKNLDYKRI